MRAFELCGSFVDSVLQIYLIEVNINPSLATNCEILNEVIPPVVEETLGESRQQLNIVFLLTKVDL